MKYRISYITAALFACSAALTSCDDDFARPPMIMPEVSDLEANMSIEDLKTQYWDARETVEGKTIGFTESNDSIILTGRVVSSDEAGNVYRTFVIQSFDENGEQYAVQLSVTSSNLYKLFGFGQEVAVNVTGLDAGCYFSSDRSSNYFLLGTVGDRGVSYMDEAAFLARTVRNHAQLPQPELVKATPTTLGELQKVKSPQANLIKWQSRYIEISDVRWEAAGYPYAGGETTSRYLIDDDGNRLTVRNSNRATFKNEILPYGKGTVKGILSYYRDDWQLTINDTEAVTGFDNVNPEAPLAGDGTVESPYTVAKAVQVAFGLKNNENVNVCVEGTVYNTPTIETQYGNAYYVIADETNSAFLYIYRGYYLDGGKFTSTDALKKGDKVVIKGDLMCYQGAPQIGQGSSILNLNGTTSGGSTEQPGTDIDPAGSGTEADPYNVAAALAAAKALDENGSVENVFTSGVIKSITDVSPSFGNATYVITDEGGNATLQVYRGYHLNGDKFTSEDQLTVGAKVVVKGTLVNFKGNTPQYTTGSRLVSITAANE
ncbi:MAG: hypothetical protein K2J38_02740 [Muribaculaceae bacterium]|nr:hypothetical protein [Muribaculaceae bacterium]